MDGRRMAGHGKDGLDGVKGKGTQHPDRVVAEGRGVEGRGVEGRGSKCPPRKPRLPPRSLRASRFTLDAFHLALPHVSRLTTHALLSYGWYHDLSVFFVSLGLLLPTTTRASRHLMTLIRFCVHFFRNAHPPP